MTKKQHLTVGIIIGLIVNYGLKWGIKNELSVGFILSIILGAIGAVLPDILEPPKSRWHRKRYHSKVLLLIIIITIILVIGLPWFNGAFMVGLLIVLISYLCHLIMDSSTPAGLPFWNR